MRSSYHFTQAINASRMFPISMKSVSASCYVKHVHVYTLHRDFSSLSYVKRVFNRVMGFIGADTLKHAKNILHNCKEQSSNQLWFTRGDIIPDFRSKQTLLMMHIWIVHKRLIMKEDDDGRRVQECLFDEFWEDTCNRIRSEGIGEMSVNKNLKDVQGYSFKLGMELDEALTKKTELEIVDEIGGALWRSLYRRDENADEGKILELAKYVRSEQLSIQKLSTLAVYEGRILWSRIPWEERGQWQDRRKGQRRAVGAGGGVTSSAADSEDKKEEVEWKEAVAADGRVYYWHPITRESRWKNPI